MLEHGGRLRQAAQRFGIPVGDWLDLSTGINPHAYPAPAIPSSVWQRLPEDDDGLEHAAAHYFGTDQLLPVAGSQPAIQAIPALIPGERVTVLAPTYAEHPHAWRDRRVRACAPGDIERYLPDTDVLLLVSPNNPSGAAFSRERLLDWHGQLATRGGWLIIDEAFIDCAPDESLAPEAGREHLVILRSLGKFFGLAGARVGFVLASPDFRRELAERLGPWTIAGPARHVARAALADAAWQSRMRERLASESARLAGLLRANGLGEPSGTALFQWIIHPDAQAIHDQLARAGILARRFDSPPSLRFGLPPDETGWARLALALSALRHTTPNC